MSFGPDYGIGLHRGCLLQQQGYDLQGYDEIKVVPVCVQQQELLLVCRWYPSYC